MNEYGVAAFRSRQQVMKFEQILKREGLNVRVISTPREVAIGCGLSVQFVPQDIRAVQNALRRTQPSNLIGLYLVTHSEDGRPGLTAISR